MQCKIMDSSSSELCCYIQLHSFTSFNLISSFSYLLFIYLIIGRIREKPETTSTSEQQTSSGENFTDM